MIKPQYHRVSFSNGLVHYMFQLDTRWGVLGISWMRKPRTVKR